MLLKIGSTGTDVKLLQQFLHINSDGIFGKDTEFKVLSWQRDHDLMPDGIVGRQTSDSMGFISTDLNESDDYSVNRIDIHKYMLKECEYFNIPTNKDYLILHHTAGWNNPYNTVKQWNTDKRGRIGTEFVIGGSSVTGNDHKYDGDIVQCIDNGGYAWHLGKNGSRYMHKHSVGIELCNFGPIVDNKTYTGRTIAPIEKCTLDHVYRGYSEWHKYSDKQLKSLKQTIEFVANRDNIDIHSGIIDILKNKSVKEAFDFNEDAYYGKIKGMWLHSNIRRDKTDLFPQPELIDMLLSL